MNKTNKENALLKEIYNLIGTKYLNLYELNDFALDGVKFNVIWPDLPGPAILETNDSSISLIISYKKLDILTLGDLSNNYEIKAVEDINHIDIDVLKVSHHGSKSSTTKKFLDITKPELSIISVGFNNSYGHPAEEVIYNLNEVGSEIYRTDLSGRVKISSDGFRIKIETEEESSVKIINLE